jgi:hypothetical protein
MNPTDATTEPVMDGDGWATPEERQAAARDAYRASVAAGAPLGAAALGARFGRGTRWAQQRIAETRNERSTNHDAGSPSDAPAVDAAAPAAGRNRSALRAQRVDMGIVAVVAVVAAVASYEHQRGLATLAGEGDLSYVLPISVDGMMLATSRSILRRRRAGRPARFLSWFGFLLGFGALVAANVAAAEPTLVGRLVAAWPPVALFIAYETLAADHDDDRRGP